jgi:multidrug resistance efflux pump
MNKLLFLMFVPLLVWSEVHYAKVEPYRTVVLKSSVNGKVLEADLKNEAEFLSNRQIIHIDDRLDRVELNTTKQSLKLLHSMLKINEEMLVSLKESMERKESYYARINKLSTASRTQKDNAYGAFSAANTQYLSTHEKVMSLQKQILDMEYKLATLKQRIEDKNIVLTHYYLNTLLVQKGDFVVPGSALAKVDDIRRAKLVLFLNKTELKELKKKHVYIDGVETAYRVDKVWKTTDAKFISSYRAEIYVDAPKGQFSSLVKVELK